MILWCLSEGDSGLLQLLWQLLCWTVGAEGSEVRGQQPGLGSDPHSSRPAAHLMLTRPRSHFYGNKTRSSPAPVARSFQCVFLGVCARYSIALIRLQSTRSINYILVLFFLQRKEKIKQLVFILLLSFVLFFSFKFNSLIFKFSSRFFPLL